MRKLLIIAGIIIVLVINSNQKIIIPKESIRLRVIANSNSKNDQEIKKKVSENITKELTKKLSKSKNIDESRKIIKNDINMLKLNINQTLQNEQVIEDYAIKFGYNYFPKKEYKSVIYESGKYESLVVTIGNGNGKNFWCVLFPPLCFGEDYKNIEYKSYVKEIINKYF